MARRPRAAVVAPVTWRDGVHLTGTPIWCDARRRRDICFVSSADRMTKAGHGQLVGTARTLGMLGADDGGHLAVPLQRRFTLGTLRLELIASGRGVGAASLYVDIAGRGVLYAGAIRSEVPVLGGAYAIEPADVRACDAVCVAVPYADVRDRYAPIAETLDRVEAWCVAELAAGRRPVLLVDGELDGIEVAAALARRGHPLAGARRIRDALQRFESIAWLNLLHGESVSDAVRTPGKEPRITVWLEGDRPGLARALAKYPHTLAIVSGREARSEVAFAWSASAGKLDLLAWIEATGARHVFLTGPGAGKLQGTLGPRARVLGPPQQMTLGLV